MLKVEHCLARLFSVMGGRLQLLPIQRCRPVECVERCSHLLIHGLLVPTVGTSERTVSITRLVLSAMAQFAQTFGPLHAIRRTSPEPKTRRTVEASCNKF